MQIIHSFSILSSPTCLQATRSSRAIHHRGVKEIGLAELSPNQRDGDLGQAFCDVQRGDPPENTIKWKDLMFSGGEKNKKNPYSTCPNTRSQNDTQNCTTQSNKKRNMPKNKHLIEQQNHIIRKTHQSNTQKNKKKPKQTTKKTN